METLSSRYPYIADVEASRLRLDLRNPRLPVEPDSQRDAFREMAHVQGSKLVAICKHIARHGLNPAQPFLVIPDDENQFIVLDANRRLTALRALEQPDLVADLLTDSDRRQLKAAADSYVPPDDVRCVVFARREDADVWIELQHEGESEGAGLVAWSAQQKARHRARGGTKAPHLQVLDFVRDAGQISPETIKRCDRGTYPVSTLERALTTPRVRERLGIEIQDGQVVTTYPRGEVLKGLSRLVDEIGSGAVRVGDLMKVAHRTKYINRFDAKDLPDPAARLDNAEPLGQAPEKASRPNGRSRDRQRSNARSKLLPASCTLNVSPPRVHDIYLELKRKLRVDEVPNASGVLFRVFIELSLDEYMDRHSVPEPKDPSFAEKVVAVAGHMEAAGVIAKKDLIPIREAVKSEDKLTLATNFNALVHNRHMTVSGNDLKALWDRLELFVTHMWS